MATNRSRWRPLRTGDKWDDKGVCTCAGCLRAIDRGEDVTCNDCVSQMAEIAYANGRADGRDAGGLDE